MQRSDITDYLVHWTSGEKEEDAYKALYEIIESGMITGSSHMIRGGYLCVCFSEAPANVFFSKNSKYKQFGICVKKNYLFENGGRPVIYQPNDDYENLSENIRWKHVHYDPCLHPPIDFTWEREWRIKTEQLELDSENMVIIVPNRSTAKQIIDNHNSNEHMRYWSECVGYGEDQARWPENFYFDIYDIKDL